MADATHRNSKMEGLPWPLSSCARVTPGAYANWISPPTLAINKQPADFEIVRF